MRDTNTVTIVGRLTRDALTKSLTDGTTVIEYSIASNYQRKKGESWIDEVNFFDCEQFFGADGVLPWLVKGKQVCVTGALRQDRWKSSEGGQRSRVKILVNHVQLLGSAGDNSSREETFSDDIPFD